ncbi:hypothetical protein RDV64_09885 [Acuticoccus sp. MNP-M23]|uniref:hypothetical protein n=1 Tax=Acuticoccus sp. MNP-M23 TaxID=3072793 RepID=UPI00281561FC|nr:hypothetical protein [Acuticoccus sp. MNP-M23]WMS44664.1 hypothetical protein RDV64_09885 [Acuticoccus sp. MNP-M23]
MAKGQQKSTKEPQKAKDDSSKAKKAAGPKYLRGSVAAAPGDLHSRNLGGVKKR